VQQLPGDIYFNGTIHLFAVNNIWHHY